jgi:excisionase family DNA binding protein
LMDLYNQFLAQTGEPAAAAILAIGAAGQPAATQDGDMLTPPQVAKRLGVTPETVIGWIKTGQLKASNIGNGKARPRYRIRQSAVDAMLAAREPEPQRKPKSKPKSKGSFKLYAA